MVRLQNVAMQFSARDQNVVRTLGSIRKSTDQTAQAASNLDRGFRRLGSTFKVALGVGGGLLALNQLRRVTQGILEQRAALQRISQATGTTNAELERLEFTLRNAANYERGVRGLERAFTSLNTFIGQAADGSAQYERILAQIGTNARELVNLTPTRATIQLLELIRGQNLPRAERQNILGRVFGQRFATDLGTLFESGGLQAWNTELARANNLLPDFNDRLGPLARVLSDRFDDLKAVSLSGFAEGLSSSLGQFDSIDDVLEGVRESFISLGTATGHLVNLINDAAQIIEAFRGTNQQVLAQPPVERSALDEIADAVTNAVFPTAQAGVAPSRAFLQLLEGADPEALLSTMTGREIAQTRELSRLAVDQRGDPIGPHAFREIPANLRLRRELSRRAAPESELPFGLLNESDILRTQRHPLTRLTGGGLPLDDDAYLRLASLFRPVRGNRDLFAYRGIDREPVYTEGQLAQLSNFNYVDNPDLLSASVRPGTARGFGRNVIEIRLEPEQRLIDLFSAGTNASEQEILLSARQSFTGLRRITEEIPNLLTLNLQRALVPGAGLGALGLSGESEAAVPPSTAIRRLLEGERLESVVRDLTELETRQTINLGAALDGGGFSSPGVQPYNNVLGGIAGIRDLNRTTPANFDFLSEPLVNSRDRQVLRLHIRELFDEFENAFDEIQGLIRTESEDFFVYRGSLFDIDNPPGTVGQLGRAGALGNFPDYPVRSFSLDPFEAFRTSARFTELRVPAGTPFISANARGINRREREVLLPSELGIEPPRRSDIGDNFFESRVLRALSPGAGLGALGLSAESEASPAVRFGLARDLAREFNLEVTPRLTSELRRLVDEAPVIDEDFLLRSMIPSPEELTLFRSGRALFGQGPHTLGQTSNLYGRGGVTSTSQVADQASVYSGSTRFTLEVPEGTPILPIPGGTHRLSDAVSEVLLPSSLILDFVRQAGQFEHSGDITARLRQAAFAPAGLALSDPALGLELGTGVHIHGANQERRRQALNEANERFRANIDALVEFFDHPVWHALAAVEIGYLTSGFRLPPVREMLTAANAAVGRGFQAASGVLGRAAGAPGPLPPQARVAAGIGAGVLAAPLFLDDALRSLGRNADDAAEGLARTATAARQAPPVDTSQPPSIYRPGVRARIAAFGLGALALEADTPTGVGGRRPIGPEQDGQSLAPRLAQIAATRQREAERILLEASIPPSLGGPARAQSPFSGGILQPEVGPRPFGSQVEVQESTGVLGGRARAAQRVREEGEETGEIIAYDFAFSARAALEQSLQTGEFSLSANIFNPFAASVTGGILDSLAQSAAEKLSGGFQEVFGSLFSAVGGLFRRGGAGGGGSPLEPSDEGNVAEGLSSAAGALTSAGDTSLQPAGEGLLSSATSLVSAATKQESVAQGALAGAGAALSTAGSVTLAGAAVGLDAAAFALTNAAYALQDCYCGNKRPDTTTTLASLASFFSGTPTAHGGERRIPGPLGTESLRILQAGETVRTRSQELGLQNRMFEGHSSGGGGNTTINVNGHLSQQQRNEVYQMLRQVDRRPRV